MQEVLNWFDKEHANAETAPAFFYRYSANGWMPGKHPIRKWQAAASKWLLTTKTIQTPYDYHAILQLVIAKGKELFHSDYNIEDIDRVPILKLITYFRTKT